jgi:hypothetical protein
MARNVPLGALTAFLFLEIDGKIQMGHAAVRESGATGKIRHLLHVRRPHDAAIVNRDIHEQPIQIDVLLRVSVYEIVVVMAGNRQHRLAVEFRVVKAVEQMNPTRA